MSFCPFQPPIVTEPNSLEKAMGGEAERHWQKCGEACALYSTKLQECVFSTIAEKLGHIAESMNRDINEERTLFKTEEQVEVEIDPRAIAEVRNEYMRKWRAKNKDKISAINKRYWAKKALEQESET